MDDTVVSDQSQVVSQNSTTTVPVQQVPTSVGSSGKEQGPVGNVAEYVTPSTPEVATPPEVKEYVEVKPEVPVVPQSAQQAGVKLAKEATPVILKEQETERINLSTPHPVLLALKKAHHSIKDSVYWLVSLILKEQDRREHTKIHEKKGDFFS